MKPTAASVIAKKSSASRLRTEFIGSLLVAEPVAHAADREQVLRPPRVALELLPQVADVDVDRPRVAVGGIAPDLLEQRLPGHHLTGCRAERGEDLELDVGQPDLLAADGDAAAARVDLELARDDRLACRAAALEHLRAAERRLHAAAELADRERLRDVVVRAHLEAEDLVDLVVLRGQHDDRHLAAAAQPAADLDPVEARQHDVEYDEVEALLGEPVEGLASIDRCHDLVAVLAKRIREQRLN